MANFFQDSGTAKANLNEAQVSEYGARGTIVVRAPTRWASNFFVVKCILENRKVLQTCVHTQGWTQGFGSDALLTAELISDLAENTWKRQRNAQQPFYFWEKDTLFVELFVELFQTFSDAIHQIEADLPMMSQAWPMLQSLKGNVSAFFEKNEEENGITDRLQVCSMFLK